MSECLTRTGPLFEVKADELEPMPNLAKSWEWSEDGHKLTMHLIEGAKWSDGVRLQRRRRDVLLGRQRRRSQRHRRSIGATPETFGDGTTLDEGRRLHRQVDLQGCVPRAVPLHDGLWHVLPAARRISSSRSIPSTSDQYLRRVQERLPARIPELPGDGRAGCRWNTVPTTSS